MALQYDEPTSNLDVLAALQGDSTLNPDTLNALMLLLGLNTQGAINVGSYDMNTLGSADSDDLALINVGGLPGETVNLVIPQDLLATAKGYILSGQANVNVTFNTIERAIVMSEGSDNVTVGGDKDTTLDGGLGNDTLTTSGGNDNVLGGIGDDTISTGAGRDRIVTGVGTDQVDGGSGYDQAALDGALGDYAISKSGTTLVLTHMTTGATSSLTNTEFVQMSSGGTIAVVNTEAEAMALRLYQTVMDRTADIGGAEYWAGIVRDGRASVTDIANMFVNSPEFVANFGGLSNEAFIRLLYEFGLNREAEDGGLNFWLNTGLNRGELAVQIVGSAEAASTITDVQLLPGTI